MAGTDARDLYLMADEFLQAGVESLDTLVALGLEGAPGRTYVSPGEPAADCEQLTVHTVSLEEAATEPTGQGGLATGRRASYGRLSHPQFFMMLFRCVPVAKQELTRIVPPSVAEQTASAQQLNADAWALWNHLYSLVVHKQLWSTCQGIFPGPMRALPESGGFGGWLLSYRVRLDGYPMEVSS